MTSLVTGATGFVGSHLVEHLLETGESVRALARTSSGTAALAARGVEIVTGDLLDPARLREVARDADAIYHLAEIRLREKDAVNKNVEAVRALADGAAEGGRCRRLVFQSSLTVRSVPETLPADEDTPVRSDRLVDDAYTRYKRMSEKVLETHAVPATVIRAGMIYGPRAAYLARFVRLCHTLRVPLPFPGRREIRLASIHVSDLARALRSGAGLSGGFRAIHAVDDEIGTAAEFLERLGDLAGAPLRLFGVPYAIQWAGARVADTLARPWLGSGNVTAIVQYMGFNHNFSNRRMKEELGLALAFPTWDEGLPGTAAWLREALAAGRPAGRRE